MKRFIPILWAALLSVVCYTGAEAASPPSTQSRYIGFSNVTSTSVDITFLRGNGAGRIVVVSTDNTFGTGEAATFTDHGGSYTAASGDLLTGGNGNDRVVDVLTGTTRSTTISNLSPGTQYYVKVYEYNDVPTPIDYNEADGTNNPRSFTTSIGAPQNVALVGAAGSTTATVAWDEIGTAEGFEVRVSYDTGANTTDGTVLANDAMVYSDYDVLDIGLESADADDRDTFMIQDITKNIDNKFEVRAYIGRNETGWGEVDFTTTNDATPPVISQLTLYSDSGLSSAWTANANTNFYVKDGLTLYLHAQFDEELSGTPTLNVDYNDDGTPDQSNISGANLGNNAYRFEITTTNALNHNASAAIDFDFSATDLSSNSTSDATISAGNNIYYDDVEPTLNSLAFTSSGNEVPADSDDWYARDGQTVYIRTIFSEHIYASFTNGATTGVVGNTLNGGVINNAMAVGLSTYTDGTDYSFNVDIWGGSTEGSVDFSGTFYDRAGNTLVVADEDVTDGSTITIDITAPTVGVDDLDISSSNVIDANYASSGQTLTIQVTSNENIYGSTTAGAFTAGNLTVEGVTDHNSNLGAVGSTTWTFDYTVQGDEGDGNTVDNVSFNIYDAAGNVRAVDDATHIGDNVTYDFTAPTASTLTVVSNNVNNDVAKSGDIVSIDFHTSENVYISGVAAASPTATQLTVEGAAATGVTEDQAQDQYTVTRTLDGGEGDGALNFSFTVSDIAGNEVTITEGDITGTNVTLDFTAPTAGHTLDIVTTGGTVVADYWNNTNTGITEDITFAVIATDPTLEGGNVVLQARVQGELTWENISSTNTIDNTEATNGSVTVTDDAIGIESLTNYADDVNIEFQYIITDYAGNSTTSATEGNVLHVDITAPTVTITRNATTNGTVDVTPDPDTYYTNDDAVSYDAAFSEAVEFESGDVSTNNSSAMSGAPSVAPDDGTSETDFTINQGTVSGNGTVGVTIANTVTDLAGNTLTGAPLNSDLFNIDNTPVILANNTFDDDVTSGGNSVAGFWNEDNTEIDITWSIDAGDADGTIVGGTLQLRASTDGVTYENLGSAVEITAVGDNTITIDADTFEGITGFAEGAMVDLGAILTDRAGNALTLTPETDEVTVDQTAPQSATLEVHTDGDYDTEVTPNAAGRFYTQPASIFLEVTADENISDALFTVDYNDDGDTDDDDEIFEENADSESGAIAYFEWDASNITSYDGTNRTDIDVTLTDLAGNVATFTELTDEDKAPWIDDADPSAFAIGDPTAIEGYVVTGYYNASNDGLTVDVPVANDLSLEGGTITLFADNAAGASYTQFATTRTILDEDLDGTYTFNLTDAEFLALDGGIGEGDDVVFRVTISDFAGNTAQDDATNDITRDETAPTITMNNVGGDLYVNSTEHGAGFNVNATSNETGTIYLTKTGGLTTHTDIQNNDFVSGAATANVAADIAVSDVLADNELSDGNRIYAYSYDAAGNFSTASGSVLVDLTAPSAANHFFGSAEASAGGNQVSGYYNEDNTQLTVTFFIDGAVAPTATMEGGTVRYYADANNSGYTALGAAPANITVDDRADGYKSITFIDGSDGLADNPEFADGANMDFQAVFTDRAGNQTTVTAENQILVDLSDPTVSSITSAAWVNEASVATGFDIVVTYNEAMNPAITPTITFDNENPTAVLTGTSSDAWSAGNTVYTRTYTVVDGNQETPADVDVEVTGGRDVAGNDQSAAGNQDDLFSIDMLAPDAPSLASIADDNGINTDFRTNDQTLVFNGGATDVAVGDTVYVYLNDGVTNSNIGIVPITAGTTWSYDHTGTTLTYGTTYTWTGVVKDEAGNTSATSAGQQIVIENSAPTVVAVAISDANNLINQAESSGAFTVTVQFNEAMNNGVAPTIAFSGTPSTIVDNSGSNAWSTTTNTNDTYTFNFTLTDANEEISEIDITLNTAEDAAGNVMAEHVEQDVFSIDNVAPTVSAVAGTDGLYGISGNVPLTVTFSETVAITGTPQLTLETGASDAVVNLTDATVEDAVINGTYTVAEGHVSADLDYVATNSLIENGGTIRDEAGNNAVLTLQTPGSGNAGSLSNTSAIVIDGVRPTVSIDAPLANAYTNGTQTVTLTTGDTGGSGLASTEARIGAEEFAAFTSGNAISTIAGYNAANNGAITVDVRTTDNAGNESTTATVNLTQDMIAPAVTLLYEETNNDLYINQAEQASGDPITARVNLTAEANADQGVSFYLTEDGAANAGNVGDNDINTAVSVTATGLSDVVIPSGNKGALATGDNVYLYAVDAAGNIGIAANSLAVDITPPTVATSFTRIEAYTGATLSLIGNPRNYRYANLNDKVVLFFNQTENLYNNYSGYVEDASPATPILDNTASGAVTASNTTLIPYNPFLTNSPFQLNWEGSVTGSSDEGPLTFSFDLWDAAGNIVTIDQNDINGVGDGNDGQNVIIDLTKPTVTDVVPSVATITDAQTGDNGFSIDITVNETYLNTAVQPTITFSPDISGTLSFDGASSSWAGNVFTAVYDVTDSGVEIADIDVIINGIADLAGNVMNEDASNTDEFSIDNLNPSATITTSDALITDADNGGTYTITATFDEAMNTGVTPTLNFAARPATLTNYSALGWTGNTVYRYSYSIGDENEETADIDFNVTGGQDVAGNTMVQSDATDILDVDQRQPLLTAVTPNLTTIADANAGDATFTLTLDFDEAMNTGVAPTVDFNTDISSTLTLDGTSGWSDADTYVARYDVADAGVSVADIDVTVTLAQDAVGNVMASDASNIDEFSIDTENPTVTSVTADQANGTYGIGSSITTQIIFSEAVTSNFGGGTPTMTFETGTTDRTVNMSDGTNNDVFLQAVYTVQEDDVTSDLDYVAANTITLNGGTITDAAGNAAVTTLPTPGAANSLGANKDIVIDGIRPTLVSISRQSPAQEITNSNAVDFRVVFSEGLSGLLSSDFQLSGAGSANGVIFNLNVVNSTTIDVQVSGLNTSGNLTLGLKPTANLSDVNGNTMTNLSATGTVQTYTMDFTNPVISISAPSANAYVNGTSTNLTFTVTETNTGTSSADASNGGNLAAFTSGSAVNTLNGWAGADGARTILVSHTDQAGNTGTATVTVTKDETNPVITWTSPAASTRVNSAYAIDFALTEANTGTSEIQVAGGSWATVTDGTTFGNIAAFSSATDGNVNIALRHTDLAGNVTTEATRTVVKDFTAPTASILAVTNTPTNANAVSWTVTFSEDVQNFDANDLTVTATNELAPNDFTVGVATVSASEYTVTVTPNNTQDNGSVYFELNTGGGTNVTDLANNAFATAVTSSTIVIDNSAPKITATSIASNNSYVDVTFDQGVYTTSGFGAVVPSDWSTTVTQNGGLTSAVTISSITKTNGNAATGGETQLRFNLSLTGLPTGQESFTIAPATNTSVYNLIGNAMETTDVSSSINLNDQTAPVVNITAPVTNAYVNGNATLTFTATDAIGVTGTTARAGAATDVAVITGATLTSISGFTAASDGVVTLTVSATDAAGNTGTATVNVNKDATNPTLTVAQLAQTETNGTHTVTITASSDANPATPFIQASVNNSDWATVANGFAINTAGGWAGLAEGNATLYVRASDLAGNTTVVSQSIVKDVTAPVLTLTPASGAINVALNSNVEIASLSEDLYVIADGNIIESSDVAGLVELKQTNDAGASIAYTGTVTDNGNGHTITLDPTNNFESNDVVYVELNAGLRDKAGNALASTNYTFTTVDNSTTRMAFETVEVALPALSDTQGERVKIATLTVTDDQGGDNDTKPTKITGITFDQGGDNQIGTWTQVFDGVEIERQGVAGKVVGTVNGTNFAFTGIAAANAGDMGYINDGSAGSFDVYAWVKADIDDAIDNTIDNAYFQIAADYNDVTTAAGGSNMDYTLRPVPTVVTDTKDSITVVGTKLVLVSNLTDVPSVSSTQNAQFEITDDNGNRDEITKSVSLTTNSGTSGVTISSPTGGSNTINGLVSFTITYSNFGALVQTTAQSSGLASATSNAFNVRANEPTNAPSSITTTPFNGQWNIEVNFTTNPTGGKAIIVAYQGANNAVVNDADFGDGLALSANVSYGSGTGLDMDNGAGTGYVVYQGTKPTSNVKIWMTPNTYDFIAYSYDGDKNKAGTVNIKTDAVARSSDVVLTKVGDFEAASADNFDGDLYVSQVYPNPVTRGEFKFDIVSLQDSYYTITLNDLSGKTVYTHANNEYMSAGEHTMEVNFDSSKIASGMYMMYVESELGVFVVPVNIQN